MGLFGPDWKSGNKEKAFAAVDKAAPDKLSEIAIKARSQWVAYRAVDRMEPDMLRDVALSEGYGNYRAVERLADLSREEDLFYIAIHAASEKIKRKAAANIKRPEAIVRLMKEEGDINNPQGMYFGIASNPNTPPDILEQFLQSSNENLLHQVIVNPSLPDENIVMLVDDADTEMCRWILNRKEIPEEVLKKLQCNPVEEIRYRAKYHFIEVEKGKSDLKASMERLGIPFKKY